MSCCKNRGVSWSPGLPFCSHRKRIWPPPIPPLLHRDSYLIEKQGTSRLFLFKWVILTSNLASEPDLCGQQKHLTFLCPLRLFPAETSPHSSAASSAGLPGSIILQVRTLEPKVTEQANSKSKTRTQVISTEINKNISTLLRVGPRITRHRFTLVSC